MGKLRRNPAVIIEIDKARIRGSSGKAATGLAESTADCFPQARWQRALHAAAFVPKGVRRGSEQARAYTGLLKAIHVFNDHEIAQDSVQAGIDKFRAMRLTELAAKIQRRQ